MDYMIPTQGSRGELSVPGLPGLSFEEAYELIEKNELDLTRWGDLIRVIKDSVAEAKWLFVEALAYGEDVFGEERNQFLDLGDFSDQTVANYASVGRRWPRRVRNAWYERYDLEPGTLPFSYWDAASRRWIPRQDAEELLHYAYEFHWTRDELRRAVKILKNLGEEGPDGVIRGAWAEFKRVQPDVGAPIVTDSAVVDPRDTEGLYYSDELGRVVREALGNVPPMKTQAAYVAHTLERWLEGDEGQAWLIKQMIRVGIHG